MSETQEGLQAKTTVRPTKKQKELLIFIEDFITAHGYSPSYREIMQGTATPPLLLSACMLTI